MLDFDVMLCRFTKNSQTIINIVMITVVASSMALLSSCENVATTDLNRLEHFLIIDNVNYPTSDLHQFMALKYKHMGSDALYSEELKDHYIDEFIKNTLLNNYLNMLQEKNQETESFDVAALLEEYPEVIRHIDNFENSEELLSEELVKLNIKGQLLEKHLFSKLYLDETAISNQLAKYLEANKNYRIIGVKELFTKSLQTMNTVSSLTSRAKFDELIDKYNDGDIYGGDLGYILSNRVSDSMEAIINTPAGRYTKVIETDEGYHLYYVYENLPVSSIRSLERLSPDMKGYITVQLYNAAMSTLRKDTYESFIEAMKDKSNVTIIHKDFTLAFLLSYYDRDYAEQLHGEDFVTESYTDLEERYDYVIEDPNNSIVHQFFRTISMKMFGDGI